MNTKPITDAIGQVVDLMKADDIEVYYLHGHRLEISNRLDKMDKHKEKKYEKFPLIAFNEMNATPVRRGSLTEWTLNIAILAKTKDEYYSPDRDELVFKPILYPLYDEFIKYIGLSGLFMWDGRQDAPPHRPFNRKFFGISEKEGNVKYIFNEPLDGIELIDFKLTTLKNC